MKLLPPLPPVLKRRSALVLGTGLLTSLVIGGVAANAQAGSGQATESKAVTVTAVGTAPVELVECASIDPSELKLTPAQPATAVAVQADGKPASVKGIAVKAVPAKRAPGTAVTGRVVTGKAVPGKLGAKAVGSGGESIATLEAVPVCVAATKP